MDFSLNELMNFLGTIPRWFRRFKFGTKAQLAFLEDLYLLINDGIPANKAVEMMALVTTGISREVALSISEKIAQGQPLAEGMQDWFSMNAVEIIRVGESGGALAQTMKSAINMLSQQGIAIGSFIGAIAYPLLVITIGCIVVIYLNNSVFEQFRMIKPMEQWPEAGQRLVGLAINIQRWWWVAILGVIIFIILFKRILNNLTGPIRDELDKYPPFSLYRRLIAARFLETLGLLVANGVVFKSAIKVMQYQANPYLLYHLIRMESLLGTGKVNIADVLKTGLVEDNDLMRLRVMAEVKGFEHGLIRMGIRGTDEATRTLKFISRIFGGVLLILGGMIIILIIQGIYLTGMSMGS
jgi:toxin co-regulated pilus biosynthesis protein E